MLMPHMSQYHPHHELYHPQGQKSQVNMGALGQTPPQTRNVPNHAVPSEYNLYQGPGHATQYKDHNVLTPIFQHVIANWLKSGRLSA